MARDTRVTVVLNRFEKAGADAICAKLEIKRSKLLRLLLINFLHETPPDEQIEILKRAQALAPRSIRRPSRRRQPAALSAERSRGANGNPGPKIKGVNPGGAAGGDEAVPE